MTNINVETFESNAAGSFAGADGNATLYQVIGKRIFDLTLAILLLPLILPIIGILGIYVGRDGGSAFFGHRRVGRNGKVFKCWKVRTMVMDAERKLLAYLAENPEAAAEWERDRKLEIDPRITKLGAFLRKTSLDELPQIFNVLKGEMSFVGPRPIVRSELHKYGSARGVYMSMRPGITGLWQVSGRNDVSYDERVQFDVEYLGMMGLKTDMGLILKTGTAVLGSTGK